MNNSSIFLRILSILRQLILALRPRRAYRRRTHTNRRRDNCCHRHHHDHRDY